LNRALNINAGLMLLIGIIFTYSTLFVDAIAKGPSAYDWGFIFGRATAGTLLPLFIVWVVRAVFRRKPMFTTGAFVSWWILFVLLNVMALFGGLLPAQT
jgi:hypothetical protein